VDKIRRRIPGKNATARLNRKGREIWFERWMWSYIPCHWKGWAIGALGVIAGVLLTLILPLIVRTFGHPEWDSAMSSAGIIACVVGLDRIAARHAQDPT
jgi:hypothetical protein